MQRAELRGLQADKGKGKTQGGIVFVRVQRTARRPRWIEPRCKDGSVSW